MQFQFSFKQMENSQALRQYAEEKIGNLIQKFVTKPIEAQVTFSVEKTQHIAQVTLIGGDGFSIQVEHTCEDMYGSVDRLLDKLATKLKRKKEKLKAHKGHRNVRSFHYVDPEAIDFESAEIDAGDIIAYEKARSRLKAS